MFCINCLHKSTRVTNSRPHKNNPSVWRRRQCSKCSITFTTYERPSLAENRPVHTSDGHKTTFNSGKLIISISKSFSHSPEKSSYDSLWLAQTVEDILSTEFQIISNKDIAAVTHQTLKKFDELAAVQYAARHHLISSARKSRRGRPSILEHGPQTDE